LNYRYLSSLALPVAAFVAALTGALGGCASLDPRSARLAEADAVVGEAVQAGRAPLAEQRASLTRAEQAFVADPSALNRLRFAAYLATLPDPLHDDARALELLRPLADAGVPGTARLGALLSTQIAERQRLARELERVTRERERADRERDKREEALKQQAEALRQQAETLKQQGDALREQVEALRAIERGIRAREEKLRRRPN
jgi:hypothetical protein